MNDLKELLANTSRDEFIQWGLAAGLFLLTATLLILMRTRWGQSRPLGKCVFLSVLAHLLLAGYSTTVEIVTAGVSIRDDRAMRVTSVDNDDTGESDEQSQPSGEGGAETRPWEGFATEPSADAPVDDLELDAPSAALEPFDLAAPELADLPDEPRLPPVAATETATPEPELTTMPAEPADLSTKDAEPIDAPAATQRIADDAAATQPDLEPDSGGEAGQGTIARSVPTQVPDSLLDQPSLAPQIPDAAMSPSPEPNQFADTEPESGRETPAGPEATGSAAAAAEAMFGADEGARGNSRGSASSAGLEAIVGRSSRSNRAGDPIAGSSSRSGPAKLSFTRRGGEDYQLPGIYRGRTAPDRAKSSRARGGSREAEAAVQAALAWLSASQSADGHWDARKFGAGKEVRVFGRDRQGAGADADMAVSGLSLMAFLGAGQTHLEGKYQRTVRDGLSYLINAQAADGNMGGGASLYAFMYCHGMATLALSEAYAMTGDEQLEAPLRRAIAYTLSAQHPANGGWRYQRGDPQGDTSQLGWQLMSLRSAELAGIEIPSASRQGMVRFLRSVASGDHSGLASYRPRENVSRVMTAEALVCRQLLGMSRDNPASDEAGDYIVQELPGDGQANLYYWYYGTMAMYQLQGSHWQRWNTALQTELVESQRQDGAEAGSWDPDPVWGGHGGRVYSTAMGALCLEVYYRFLPLYTSAAGAEANAE